jgi:hypothetical protein
MIKANLSQKIRSNLFGLFTISILFSLFVIPGFLAYYLIKPDNGVSFSNKSIRWFITISLGILPSIYNMSIYVNFWTWYSPLLNLPLVD